MREAKISTRKAILIIVVAFMLSLAATLVLVYLAPSIFPPLSSAHLNDGAVVSEKIADEAVITTKLADGSVTSAKIVDGTVVAVDLADGSIITAKIADGAVTTNKIADGALTGDKIADGAVATSKIADSAILTIKLADDSVTSAKILDGTITAADLASGLLTTMHIADGAVITSKIADYAVTDIKLAAGAIPFAAVHNSSRVSTTSPTWVDMPATAVNLTLTRTSNLIITFSTEAWLGSASGYLNVRAMVNTTQAYPTNGTTTITRDNTVAASYSFTFYSTDIPAGTYTVTMQWQTPTGTQATVEDRTLTIIALPA